LSGGVAGKPPSEGVLLDLAIHNPLPYAVWFVWDPIMGPSSEYAARVTEASVSRVLEGRPAYLWEFLPEVILALRLASGAQVTLKQLRIEWFHRPGRLTFAFAQEIRVGGIPAAGWIGADGYTQSVEMFRLGEHSFTDRRRTDPRPEGADFDISVLCTVSVDVPPH
jgi:hypothetical protein